MERASRSLSVSWATCFEADMTINTLVANDYWLMLGISSSKRSNNRKLDLIICSSVNFNILVYLLAELPAVWAFLS